MDKEQARLVLSSFRPDGADAGDPDFAGALHLAAEDRELGEWLAAERARDAEFSAALGRVAIPEDLRHAILSGFAIERGEMPQPHDDLDRSFMAALAAVTPPAGLREKLLAEIEMQAAAKPVERSFPWFRLGLPMAAAAGVAFAFLVTRPPPKTPIAHRDQVRVEAVQASFIKTFQSPEFALEHQSTDHNALFAHLQSEKLPCPGCHELPKGLQGIPSLGCRELIINGKHGALICFNRGTDGLVHLIVFRREDVQGDLPPGGPPRFVRADGDWSAAMWSEGDQAYVLMGKLDEKQLAALF